jgi:hypothetical protein
MRNIRRHDDRSSTRRFHLAPCGFESVDAAGEQSDVGTPTGEGANRRAPDASRCTGDDDDLFRHTVNVSKAS